MRKYKKVVSAIILFLFLAGAASIALYFMGIVHPIQGGKGNSEKEAADRHSTPAVETDNEKDTAEEPWQIVFKGFEFHVKPLGNAAVHESGCLNIRNCNEYLIQIDVEDKTVNEFWENRNEKIHNIEEAGYVMQLTPEKTDIGGKEYIRYIVSLENERGSDYENSYFYVLLTEAYGEKRFLTTVRFDGTDAALLSAEERNSLYEKALKETTDIINSASPSDKSNDAPGTYFEEEKPAAYLPEDSLSTDKFTIFYKIPEEYYLTADNETGKTYYSEEDRTHVITSIIPYSWITAEDMAEHKNNAGISKVVKEGSCEVNGVIYYYYTYSVMFMKKKEKSCSYYFCAFADLENGDIYSLHGFADNNPEITEVEYYYDFMNIVQVGN